MVRSPDLNKEETLEHFHIGGNLLDRMDKFNSLVIEGHIEWAAYFNNLALILSNPIALFCLSESNCWSTVDSSSSFSLKEDLSGFVTTSFETLVDVIFSARTFPIETNYEFSTEAIALGAEC